MAALEQKSFDQGLQSEQLSGRTQQVFFSPEEGEHYLYPYAYEVDFDSKAEFDAADMEIPSINKSMSKRCAFLTNCICVYWYITNR